MKKTYLFIAFLLASLMLFCACTGTSDGTGAPSMEGTTLPETEMPEPTVEISYSEFRRRETRTYKTDLYSFSDDSLLLSLTVPDEWHLSRSGEDFEILRRDTIIGYITGSPAEASDEWTAVDTKEFSGRGVAVTRCVERFGAGKAAGDYRYRYVYSYNTDGQRRTVTLTVALSQVDARCEEKLLQEAILVNRTTSETVGILSECLGDSSSILILGNSFIGTSDIGNILKEMLYFNGKSCQVTAISRGYARVATYIGDAALMDQIQRGVYDAVFICGFYAAEEVQNLGVLKNACDKALIELVIFPAHNENASLVANARNTYPSLKCLNWKGELDGLIAGGVDRWDLCINDSHKHSTPLAGYVGAHMIYRAIYDELPSKPMRTTVPQDYIDHILGDYAYVGDAKDMDKSKIIYLG